MKSFNAKASAIISFFGLVFVSLFSLSSWTGFAAIFCLLFLSLFLVFLLKGLLEDWAFRTSLKGPIFVTLFYVLLLKEILKTGMKVAFMVLNPSWQPKVGLLKVKLGSKNPWIESLSSMAITATPGELVVASASHNESKVQADAWVLVHALDGPASKQSAQAEQDDRLRYLKEFL